MSAFNSVLLIEDNPGDVRLVQSYLAGSLGASCQVRSASTLAAGLTALREAPVDVVLLDLGLPDSEGLATFLEVQAEAPRTPVVIFTGSDDDVQAAEALRVGAEDYLAKQHADSVGLIRTLRHAVQRRRAADAVRATEARFRTIVETAEEGILQVAERGEIRFANARMAGMVGMSVEALIGRSLHELVDTRQRGSVESLLATDIGRRSSRELHLRLSDALHCCVLAAAGRVGGADANGELVVMLTDITGRRIVEDELRAIQLRLESRVAERTAQLEALNADLMAFNRTVAHDLRGPLSAILSLAELMQVDHQDVLAERHRDHLSLIGRSALGMSHMLDALLSLAGVHQRALESRSLPVSDMVRTIAARLGASQPGRRVQWRIQPGLEAVGDPQLVTLLLENLLQNAWKYSEKRLLATVYFGRDDSVSSERETVYCVRDNGVGFEMASAQRLFKLFHRLPSAAEFSGTGIGLATVRRIVERHGGRVWAESVPGQGAAFYFSLGSRPAALH